MMSFITRSSYLAVLAMMIVASLLPCGAQTATPAQAPQFIILNGVSGYTFIDVDGPNAGNAAEAGTNLNGISNGGVGVGFDIDNNGSFHNFFGDVFGDLTLLDIEGSNNAMAFGINVSGDVVGTDGNGNAFFLRTGGGKVHPFIPGGGSAATAFGINNNGNIVGQYTLGNQMPGFYLASHEGNGFVRIDAPSGADVVNAQGVNQAGQIVGFYVGTDGQDHGFMANAAGAKNGQLTGTAVADPTIPAVSGEPGATFVFSQILAVNNHGIAVGYYGDSTTSQHGFLYNLATSQYTFLDDPAEAFDNGVEVTQITGITASGEITGFYSDARGVFHGFFAWPNGLSCPVSNASAVQ